jgi:catechol 2,3-dioxygenase-like lactoylglutathione lyase family enzyme
MPLRADHVVIPVRDAARAVAFYGDTLGLPLLDAIAGDDWDGFPWLMMIFGLDDDRQLVIAALRGWDGPAPDRLPRDARHYAFAVDSDAELDAWRTRITAATPPIDHWEEDHGSQRSIYLADPEGTILEITTPPSAAIVRRNPGAAAVVARWRSS